MDARSVSSYLPTDPRYAPFGLRWLRGLSAGRIGLVLLAGLMLSARSAVGSSFADDVAGALAHLAASAPRNLLTWMPGLVAVTVADNLTAGRESSWRITAFIAAALLAGLWAALLINPVYCLVFGYPPRLAGYCALQLDNLEPGHLPLFTYAGIFTGLAYYLSRNRAHAASLHQALLVGVDADRQLAEARLRGLRAQIEPHFLFNTLAHVRRLYQIDPAQGRRMLRDLVAYLRAALPELRGTNETLGGEVALIRAYLRLQQIRMGSRLAYEIDVPEELLGATLPPMMLITLVENAVKHGVGPKRGGGRITVRARRTGDRLEIEVIDNGVGLPVGVGTGVGLANTKARLETQFGSAAGLEIASGEQGGVAARLCLPLWQRVTEALTT
jgi:signal transduction histidine kinase